MKDIFSKRLKSARIMAGLSMDELAVKIGNLVTKQALQKYEAGKMLPDSTVLIALSKALEVKPEYFFRTYSVELGPIEFRKKSKLGVKATDTIKNTVIDTLERYLQLEEILSITAVFDNPIKGYGLSGEDLMADFTVVEQAAIKLREKWELGNDPIPNVLELLEDREIKVLAFDNLPEDFDGLATFVNGNIPVVVINNKTDAPKKRFTALHELGHLLLQIPDKYEPKVVEKFCHRFAGAVLMPQSALERALGKKRHHIALFELAALKAQYGISIAALMARAFECEIISENHLKQFFIWRNQREDYRKENPDVVGGYFNSEEQSSRFNRLLHKAVAEKLISISRAAELAKTTVNALHKNFQVI